MDSVVLVSNLQQYGLLNVESRKTTVHYSRHFASFWRRWSLVDVMPTSLFGSIVMTKSRNQSIEFNSEAKATRATLYWG
jgi:hypothetical protein